MVVQRSRICPLSKPLFSRHLNLTFIVSLECNAFNMHKDLKKNQTQNGSMWKMTSRIFLLGKLIRIR